MCQTNLILIAFLLGFLSFAILGIIVVSDQTPNEDVIIITAIPTMTPTPTGFVGTFQISGYVVDAQNAEPIPGAVVSQGRRGIIQIQQPPGAIAEATTDAYGYYEIGPVNLRDTDSFSMMVTAEGYWPNGVSLANVPGLFCLNGQEDFYMAPTHQPHDTGYGPCFPTPTPTQTQASP